LYKRNTFLIHLKVNVFYIKLINYIEFLIYSYHCILSIVVFRIKMRFNLLLCTANCLIEYSIVTLWEEKQYRCGISYFYLQRNALSYIVKYILNVWPFVWDISEYYISGG